MADPSHDAPKLVTVLRPAVASSASASITRPSRPPTSPNGPVAQPPSKPPASSPLSVQPSSQPPTSQPPSSQPPSSQPPSSQPPSSQPPSAHPPSSQPPSSQPPSSQPPSAQPPSAQPHTPQPQEPTPQPPTAHEPTPPAQVTQPPAAHEPTPPAQVTQPPASHEPTPPAQSSATPPAAQAPNAQPNGHAANGAHSGPPTEQSSSITSRTESENDSEYEEELDQSHESDDEEQQEQPQQPQQSEPEPKPRSDSASQAKKIWAIVKFSYDTSDAEELPLQPDEVIEILQQTDDGWWKGKNIFGKEGIFPHNFVVITDDPTSVVRASPIMLATSNPIPAYALPASDFTPPSNSSSPALSLKSARRSIFQKKKSKEDDLHSASPSPTLGASGSAIRKNSGEKPKKDRRSATLSGNSTPSKSSSTGGKIVTSPSMNSLPSLLNKAHRSPSESNMQYPVPTSQNADSSSSKGIQPSSGGLQNSSSGAFSSVSSPNSSYVSPFSSSTSSLPPYSPSSTPPPSSPEPSPRLGAVTTITSPGGESFIMKIHIPPSGSSQFKVSPNQTVGELIAMVAKKRVYNVKDCSMRLPFASSAEAPIDPSTLISHIGTRELRLFLGGESAATLPPTSQPIPTPIPAPAPTSYGQYAMSSNTNGRSLKEGYMNKADANRKMKKAYVTLDKNFIYFYKTALDKNPTERISLYCATPKLSSDPKKKNHFDLVTVTNTYSFATDTDAEANLWVNALQEACQSLIMKQIGETPTPPKPSAERKVPQQHTKELVIQTRDQPDNNTCAECGAPNPEWAAINLGIFFCIDCSGIHRSMGVHISQVRSVVLDHWDLSQVMIMENMGNKRANEFWEHTIPPQYTKPNPKSTIEEREEWIRAKYQQKMFIESASSAHTGQRINLTAHKSDTSPAPSPREEEPKYTPTPTATPTTPASTPSPATPTPTEAAPPQSHGPQRIPGLDFVGYGFFANLDDPARPSLRRQMRLFKNSFDENRTVHVAVNNAPTGTWRDVEYVVVDHYSVDTSSVRGYVPAATKVFEKHEDYLKFLSSHTHPQLDSYRQTVSLTSENATNTDTPKWYVVTELRMELYELFVDQIDDEGLSSHVTKAAPVLTQGDPALLAQFIKKNGTHFVRSAVYGGRTLLKTLVDKTIVPDKDEAARLCHSNFKILFESDGQTHNNNEEEMKKVQNYTLDITGGDNRKRGVEWVQSIWDRPQVLSYDMESISQVFDDLSLGVKIEAAANEYIEKTKG